MDPQKYLKSLSIRSIWLELIPSLATFNIPIQLAPKFVWMLKNRMKKGNGFEYEPEMNRLDAASSFE